VGPPLGATDDDPGAGRDSWVSNTTDADQRGTDGVVAMNVEAGPPDLPVSSRRRPLNALRRMRRLWIVLRCMAQSTALRS
jgi:hypothetical protein